MELVEIPRRKKQPSADAMREQLALAATEKIHLLTLLDDAVPMVTVCALMVVSVVTGFTLGWFVS